MTTDERTQEIQDRARDAAAILADEQVIGGLRRMSERLISDWRNTARSNPVLRDELHAQVAAIDALVSLWERDIEDAKFLEAKLAKAARR